ncbi:MAG: TetR/AcrR family transcriptional regulator [Pontibacterium sp.]
MKKLDLSLKKQPLQQRSKFLVKAIKEAATHVLKVQGVAQFNTNSVAERAGVSIGSLYQYFGSKEVLIAEIKRDHFDELRQFFTDAHRGLETGTLTELVDAFVDASVKGHLLDPELHQILSHESLKIDLREEDHSGISITVKVEQALEGYRDQLRADLDISIATKLIYLVVEQTIHETLLNEPDSIHQEKIIRELKRMVLNYLQ